jgi:hypothetical protein
VNSNYEKYFLIFLKFTTVKLLIAITVFAGLYEEDHTYVNEAIFSACFLVVL